MKTLHFISLNSCFVSIHVVVRFTHAYRDFVSVNDYAIFIKKSQVYSRVNAWKTCSLRCTCWGTGGSLPALKPTRKHLQLSTDNKKLNNCYKMLVFSDGTPFKRSKKPSYWHAQGGVYGKSRIIFAALDRLFIISWTSTTELGLSEFVQNLVAPVWQRYVLIALTR